MHTQHKKTRPGRRAEGAFWLALLGGSALGLLSLAQAQPAVTTQPVRPGVQAPANLTAPVMQPNLPVRRDPNPPQAAQIGPGALNPLVTATSPSIVARQIADRMAGNAVGVAVSVRMPDGRVGSAASGMARRAPDTNPRAMTADERISIASVSKIITAATTLKMLRQRNLPPTTAIGGRLPGGWWSASHPTFRSITYAQLMNHSSGIRGCGISNEELRQCTTQAILPANAVYFYENANHAMLRIMIGRLQGLGSIGDASDTAYADVYRSLANSLVLAPAGIATASCAPSGPHPALSYEGPANDPTNFSVGVGNGENWGDMNLVCGSQGWNLSANDLSALMHNLIVTYRIMPAPDVGMMMSQGYGLFWTDLGQGVRGWGHGGYHPWDWPGNNGELNTFAFTTTSGISVGLIINSTYRGNYQADLAAVLATVTP